MFKYLNHDLRLLKFNKPLHFFAEMPHAYLVFIAAVHQLHAITW